MTRRNFIIVDDIPILGSRVHTEISNYYNTQRIYGYDIKIFTDETHFGDALGYITTHLDDIDIIFSDQKLIGGSGIDLFKAASADFPTEHPSVTYRSAIYRVMHSSRDKSLRENQLDYLRHYEHFINSEYDTEESISEFLDLYESKILDTKINGNPTYRNYLYEKSLLQTLESEVIEWGKDTIPLKNILFFVMDKDGRKSEYYHCYYYTESGISKTEISKKITINQLFQTLEFFTGNLKDGLMEKIKINPLWVSYVDKQNGIIYFIPQYNMQLRVAYEKLTIDEKLLSNDLDRFFYK